MSTRRWVNIVASLVLVLAIAAGVLLLHRVDRLRTGFTAQEVLYIPSPKIVKRFSLGYGGLLADVYWTRVVQYFGGKHHARSMEYKLLAPLLDTTTTLDPQLLPAYKFGAIFLAQKPPEGAGDPDAAVALVKKGIAANPKEWRLYADLGYIEYIEKKDYSAAAQAFQKGSEIDGALPWMRVMAAVMAQHGGEISTARLLWRYIYESSQEKIIKENAVNHLLALQVDEQVEYLESLIHRYWEAKGKLPGNWFEMISAGYLRQVPVDPTGKMYKLMPDGRVEVSDPDSLPFITKGLPAGRRPEIAPGVKA